MRLSALLILLSACLPGADTDDTDDTTDDSAVDTTAGDDDAIVGLTTSFVPHALLRDGDRLWVAGEEAGDMALAALRWSDLTLDPGWKGGERLLLDFGGPTGGFLPQDVDAAFAITRFGANIAIGGVAQDYVVPGAGVFGVALLDDDGALVSGFGDGGLLTTDWTVPAHVQALAADATGLLAWGAIDQGGFTVAAARYDGTGAPDLTYSDDGTNPGVVVPGDGNEGAQVFVRDGDSLIVGGPSPVLRRYGPDGRLDAGFAADAGAFRQDDGFFNLGVSLPGGDLLVAGTIGQQAEDGTDLTALRLLRLTPDGELVTSWADGGQAIALSPLETITIGGFSLPGSVVKVRGLGVAGDGRIVVYAQALTITGQAPILMVLTADGALDTSFGDGGAVALGGAFALFEGGLIGKDDLLLVDGDEAVIIDTWLRDAPGGGVEAFPAAVRVPL